MGEEPWRMALALTRLAAMDAPMTKVQTTTRSITVKAEAFFVPERSSAIKSNYFFAYRIEIENDGEVPVRLMNRHWIITDGNNTIREIEGEGVVGQQPDIMPGQSYSYSSGAILSTKTGTMEGSYKMRSFEGIDFNAIIEPFGLIHPNSLQ